MKKLLFIFLFAALFTSCKKDEVTPNNPYDDIDYGNETPIDTLDPNGIVSIHRDILLPKCSTPGCHDGTFEPDFRTVMSSYSTLVYHPIIKNNPTNDYEYRVVPFDTTNSVLQKRLNWTTFANTNDRMPQDNIGTGLPQDDLDRISAWILGGAKDFQGNVAVMPNKEPRMQWFYCLEGGADLLSTPQPYNVLSGADNREDNQGHLSMILDTNMRVLITADITDDSTAMKDLENVRLDFSYLEDDFSSPIHSENGQYFTWSSDEYWYFLFNVPETFLQDTTIYMRINANDGDHADDTYFPQEDSYDWYKTYWSINVQEGSHQ